MFSFTIHNREVISLEPVEGSQGLEFYDLTYFRRNRAYACLEAIDDHQVFDTETVVEINSEFSKVSFEHTAKCVYYKNGKNLRKDRVDMSIAYLSSINTVEIKSNPDNPDYSTLCQTTFDFPVDDFVMVDENKIIAIGKMGRVCFKAFKGSDVVSEYADFQLELEKKEMISCLTMCSTSRYIAIATTKLSKLKRIFLYERKFDTVMMHLSTFDQSESFFAKLGGDDGGSIIEMNFDLYDQITPILVAFEQEGAGAMRAFKVFGGQLNEVAYHKDFFFGIYRCSAVHNDCLWTLDSLGFLRMTPLSKVVEH